MKRTDEQKAKYQAMYNAVYGGPVVLNQSAYTLMDDILDDLPWKETVAFCVKTSGFSHVDTAKYRCVSRNVIRQDYHRACRKLRHPLRMRILDKGVK